jgi:cytochrome P450
MEIPNISIVYISCLAILGFIIYSIVYRLYLSPIAHIPGPKIAALTWWYEYYHDVVHYGKYIWKVQEFHQQYGPIVRISPYEVHINDPDFLDVLYAASNTNRKDKWHWYTAGLGLPLCTMASDEQNLHRRRRAAMSPFFSKQNVRKLEPLIEERASTLATKLERLVANEEVVPLNLAFSAYMNGTKPDII